jgi:hypothetical protein
MRARLFCGWIAFSLLILSSSTLLAEEKIIIPNLKDGLWETTMSHSGSGLPGIPPEALAKMTPEQRAQMEAMMKQRGMSSSGGGTAVKSCWTKDKIAKGIAFNQNRENCTFNQTHSSSTHMEFKIHCENNKDGNKTTMDGTTMVDVIGSEAVKGTSHIVSNTNGRPMTMDTTFTSRYLGSDCGDVK